MTSRRDQVHAHAYMVSRLTCALVHGEPDAHESPFRRTTLGSFGGVMIGALGVAGFLVWGLIFPSSAVKLVAGSLIVTKDTGASYIYTGRELRPVLNWSSARLLMGGQPQVQLVSAASLASVPDGQPLGIVGAPENLPSPSTVNRGGWLVCAGQGARGSADRRPLITLAIGVPAVTRQVSGRDAMLAEAGGSRYLLWQGHRLRFDAPWITAALGLSGAPVISVSPGWLDSVPAGPDLTPVGIGGAGRPGPVLAGQATHVGEVLLAHNVGSPGQLYLVQAGGVVPITMTQAALALTDPALAAAYPHGPVAPVAVSSAVMARAPVSHAALPDRSGVPASPPAPEVPGPAQDPCMYYAGGAGTAPQGVFVISSPPAGTPPAAGAFGVTAATGVADRITVASGGGAFVRPQSAPGVAGNSLFLVTDTGVKFPVPSAGAAKALGYPAGTAEQLPTTLLRLLPTGPALNLPALGR